jgi:hypothetical protein
MLQAAWWTVFGMWTYGHFQRVLNNDFGCFYDLGAFQLCYETQSLSIYGTLLLLTTQSLISRILVPGMSNFVNASVSRLFLPELVSLAS